jgi:hypothetical protein
MESVGPFLPCEIDAESVTAGVVPVSSLHVEGKEVVLEFVVDVYTVKCLLGKGYDEYRKQAQQQQNMPVF